MTRTLLSGGRVFDGTGAPPAAADVRRRGRPHPRGRARARRRRGRRLGGRHLLPGLFDCHTHVTLSSIDLMGMLQTAVLLPLLRGRREPGRHAGRRHHQRARRRRRRPRHQAGGGGRAGRRGRGCRSRSRMLSQTGGHGDGWYPSATGAQLLARLPGHARRPGRRARRDAPQGPRAGPGGRRRHQGRDQRRRAVPARRPPPRPLPRRRADRAGRRGGRRRPLGDGPRPGHRRHQGAPSAPASARSSTASTSTTRPSR